MANNPNPARITSASWRYVEARLALDQGDAIYAGSYVNKPGYHGTRAENQARDRIDGSKDYSVRLPQDLAGPSDKTAGYDIKYASAAAGRFGPMARRGAYVLAAFEARDPRLFGWREWLGQTDPDRAAEGLDFVTWTKRVPDDTHEWHDHGSELREHVESWDNKACMLSILSGESLSAYLARGGRLVNGGTTMTWEPTPHEIVNALANGSTDKGYVTGKEANAAEAGSIAIVATVNLRTMDAKLDKLLARPTAEVDAKALAAELAALGVTGATPAQVETAMRNVLLNGVSPDTPA